jgi:hypothetical protein
MWLLKLQPLEQFLPRCRAASCASAVVMLLKTIHHGGARCPILFQAELQTCKPLCDSFSVNTFSAQLLVENAVLMQLL